MALTERSIEDSIDIRGELRQIHVRLAHIIERDGVEISRTFSRHVVSPLDDVSEESVEVQAIVATVHTDKVRAAYAAHCTAQLQASPPRKDRREPSP